jgi:TonB family protein
MAEIITYPVEVSVCIILFYGLYVLALKNETHFRFNRIYLLFSIVVSLLIPLLNIPVYSGNSETVLDAVLQTVQVSSGNLFVIENDIPKTNNIEVIYLTVILILSIKLIISIVSVYALRRRCTIEKRQGLSIALCNDHIAPFSFFSTVFIQKGATNDVQFDKIMLHETVHIRQHHSIDIIISEIICLLTWFNPLSWMLKSALKETHEYLADSGVSQQSTDTTGYFMLLIRNAVGLQPEIANNLNKSLILKRLNMMKKPRSNRFSMLKALPVIPIALVLFFVFSCKNSNNASETQNLDTKEKKAQEEIIVDKMPEFKGGHDAMTKYMIENIKYPEEAKKNGIQGKVFVSFTVTKTGKLENLKVLKNVNELLDAEALRVLSTMPDWIPGESKGTAVDVEITLPIMFKLS